MGNPRAFLTIHRQEAGYRPVHERIDDFSEVEQTLKQRRPPYAGLPLHGLWRTLLPLGLPAG